MRRNLPLAATHLVQTAKDNGGYDNVSVILAKVKEPFPARAARLVVALRRLADAPVRRPLGDGEARSSATADTVVDQCLLDDARVTIGRAKGNRIVVDDPSVGGDARDRSRPSATTTSSRTCAATTLSVNGTPLRRRILQHDDVIELGAFNLRFVDSKSSSEIDLERTMLIPGLKFNPDRRPQDMEVTQDLHVPSSRARERALSFRPRALGQRRARRQEAGARSRRRDVRRAGTRSSSW